MYVSVSLSILLTSWFYSGTFSPKDIGNLIKKSEKMIKFDHMHVMSLIGVCVDTGIAPYIIMPYMANGSVLACLRRERLQLLVACDAGKDVVSGQHARNVACCHSL